jgi:hypothetical protein
VAARRFPPPWSAEETDACFIVRDANGRALAYVYFERELGRPPLEVEGRLAVAAGARAQQ